MFRSFVLATAALAVSATAHARAVSFRCNSTVPRSTVTFFINVDVREAGISERNRSSIQASINGHVFGVEGCVPADKAQVNRAGVYVECAADGDAGFLDLSFVRGNRLVGKMNFPEGNRQFGLDQDSEIPLACVRTL